MNIMRTVLYLEANFIEYEGCKRGKCTKDQLWLDTLMHVIIDEIIAYITADIEEHGRLTIQELARARGVSFHTIQNIIHEDLGLSKKSARWLPKILFNVQKFEKIQIWH